MMCNEKHKTLVRHSFNGFLIRKNVADKTMQGSITEITVLVMHYKRLCVCVC